MHKNKNLYKILIGVGVILLVVVLWSFVPSNQKADGVLQELSIGDIESVDATNWRVFDYEDFNYSFKVPENWIVARSFDPKINSDLREGENKQSLAISSGENYLYIYPEGGFQNYIDLRLKDDNLLESYSAKILDYDVNVDKYEKGHYVVKFVDFHDFTLEIFVDKNAENYSNTYKELENILKNMELE